MKNIYSAYGEFFHKLHNSRASLLTPVHNRAHFIAMKKPCFDAEIKVRVAGWLKKTLEEMAYGDELELSDEVRRALKDYVTKRSTPQAA